MTSALFTGPDRDQNWQAGHRLRRDRANLTKACRAELAEIESHYPRPAHWAAACLDAQERDLSTRDITTIA